MRRTLFCMIADHLGRGFRQRHLAEHVHGARNAAERIAQVVSQHGDELLAKARGLALVEQRRFAVGELAVRVRGETR